MKYVAYVISMVLFLGGFVLMGYAFDPGSGAGFMFFGGLLAVAASIFIPLQVLKSLDR